MQIAEMFRSKQGEGLLTGTQSFFVRASGCNLRCTFCDTPYTSWEPQGEDLSVAEILDEFDSQPLAHAVITGGEPMLFSELLPLCEQLQKRQVHITVETAGTLYLPLACDLMSISPKMSNSTPEKATDRKWRTRHERTRLILPVLQRLIDEYDHQLKFVVERMADVAEIDELLEQLQRISPDRIMLMPEGVTTDALEQRAAWLEPLCIGRGFVFCPRKHIEWYGLTPGS